MVPSANRFQHHFKLRSIYKHHCVFFVIMAFFEVNVYNYQKDVPSRKCIISWKIV